MAGGIGWIALTASVVALTGATGSTRSDLEIRLVGRYYTEPATVQLIVSVEPNAANRVLRVEADGDNMFCSTEQPLDGDREARLHTIQFKNLSAGDYTLRAQVLAGDVVRSEATEEIMVTGSRFGRGRLVAFLDGRRFTRQRLRDTSHWHS
jgi:hypothetical protein